MFETLSVRKLDGLLALMQAFRTDPREEKVDLVVGVYKAESGNVPVMKAVKEAEQILLAEETTKNYVGITGDQTYCSLVSQLVLGNDGVTSASGRVASIQTPGGTGALKVACDLLNAIEPGKRIWVSTPTWANHIPIATDAGLGISNYPYFCPETRGLNFDAMIGHLRENSRAGDALLLHACCHNPTGVDLNLEQWKDITTFVKDRGLIPLVDCAYQGLGDGMQADVDGLRHMAASVPEILITSSCSKNFAIYRERAGALILQARNKNELLSVYTAAETVIRSNYSMPPSHGARIVATVLQSDKLRPIWSEELNSMRARIAQMRTELRDRIVSLGVNEDISFFTNQQGMFSYTGFSTKEVLWMREKHGIYMGNDGRVNVAALCSDNLQRVAEAMADRLMSQS